jgi:dethiobiotin synthase
VSGRIVFVSGTDTGIGKTVVSATLLANLCSLGINAKAIKPIETGCVINDAHSLISPDSDLLDEIFRHVTNASEVMSTEQHKWYRFVHPVAPLVAAKLESLEINKNELVDKINKSAESVDILIVEGAGGLMVPITNTYTFTDMVLDCNMSVIFVVGSKLGAINHTLLSFELLKARAIPAVGYVFNDLFMDNADEREAIQTNRELIKEVARGYEIVEIGYMPKLKEAKSLPALIDNAKSRESHKLAQAVLNFCGIAV